MLKPTIEIDGSRFDTLNDFWEEISVSLIPGTRWGRDFDAFNDVLRGGLGTPRGGFRLRWVNFQRSYTRKQFVGSRTSFNTAIQTTSSSSCRGAALCGGIHAGSKCLHVPIRLPDEWAECRHGSQVLVVLTALAFVRGASL